MRADLTAAAVCAVIFLPCPAQAQTPAPASGPEYTLTEAGAPTARPWEKAAIVSGVIDRDGRDYYEVHANADLRFDLLQDRDADGPTRTLTLGPNLSWNRSTREGKEQNELKAGAVLHYFNEPSIGRIDPDSNPLFWALQVNADFARAAVYPDRKREPCSATAPSLLCEVQHKESLKGKASVFPFLAGFEDLSADGRFAYSFRPQLQVAHEEILNGTLDPTTLTRVTGGYTSVLVGAGLNVRPQFALPRFELNATVQLRQRIGISGSRASLVERSAERIEVSATYFVAQDDGDSASKNWRVGLSVTWTEGSDPFEEKPKASTILFGLRIGRL